MQAPATLGNDVVDRAVVDAGSDMAFVDTSRCFPSDGTVTKVQLFSGRVGAAKFKIYRPDAGSFKLVSETVPIEISAAGQLVDYDIPAPMKFKEGDCIGWSHQYLGAIDFDYGEEGGDVVRWKKGANDAVGSTVEFTSEGVRTYSLAVQYQPEGKVKPYAQCQWDMQGSGGAAGETCVRSTTNVAINCRNGVCVGGARSGDKCRSNKYSGSNHKGDYVCQTGLRCVGYVDGKTWGSCKK